VQDASRKHRHRNCCSLVDPSYAPLLVGLPTEEEMGQKKFETIPEPEVKEKSQLTETLAMSKYVCICYITCARC
jgi:hypothetical protein